MDASAYRIILFGWQIERLKKFYVDNFGFTVIEETREEWVVLDAGQIEIALHKINEKYKDLEKNHLNETNNVKLVFKVNDVALLRNKLKKNSVDIQEIKSFTGYNSLFCDGQDCEGNRFQLEQRLNTP